MHYAGARGGDAISRRVKEEEHERASEGERERTVERHKAQQKGVPFFFPVCNNVSSIDRGGLETANWQGLIDPVQLPYP